MEEEEEVLLPLRIDDEKEEEGEKEGERKSCT